jgi:hypothetical protein
MKKNFTIIICCPIIVYSIFTIFLVTSSCSENSKNNNNQLEEKSAKTKPPIIKKPGSSFDDTISVSVKAAVFYSPDSLQMDKIKAANEKAIFDMLTHDCHYQMQNARIELKKYWPQLHVVEATKARYILFVKKDKSKICIDLNKKNDICGLFLFDTKKDPVLVDMPNIDTELGFYFSK